MSTIKEVFSFFLSFFFFFLATTPSTLSSELLSGTRARGLEPGPHHWNNSRRVGLGFWGEVGSLQWHQGIPVDISLSSSGRWGPPQGCQGIPGDSPPSSAPTDHRLGMCLWGATGLGMSLSSVLTRCIRSRVWGRGFLCFSMG